jgi:hypothetical protein
MFRNQLHKNFLYCCNNLVPLLHTELPGGASRVRESSTEYLRNFPSNILTRTNWYQWCSRSFWDHRAIPKSIFWNRSPSGLVPQFISLLFHYYSPNRGFGYSSTNFTSTFTSYGPKTDVPSQFLVSSPWSSLLIS